MGQQPQASCSHPGASITKQFELVPLKAGALTVAPYDAPAPYPWSRSVCWCLAEGYRIGDPHYPVDPCSSTLWTLFQRYWLAERGQVPSLGSPVVEKERTRLVDDSPWLGSVLSVHCFDTVGSVT